jgi:hypothetical protein
LFDSPPASDNFVYQSRLTYIFAASYFNSAGQLPLNQSPELTARQLFNSVLPAHGIEVAPKRSMSAKISHEIFAC